MNQDYFNYLLKTKRWCALGWVCLLVIMQLGVPFGATYFLLVFVSVSLSIIMPMHCLNFVYSKKADVFMSTLSQREVWKTRMGYSFCYVSSLIIVSTLLNTVISLVQGDVFQTAYLLSSFSITGYLIASNLVAQVLVFVIVANSKNRTDAYNGILCYLVLPLITFYVLEIVIDSNTLLAFYMIKQVPFILFFPMGFMISMALNTITTTVYLGSGLSGSLIGWLLFFAVCWIIGLGIAFIKTMKKVALQEGDLTCNISSSSWITFVPLAWSTMLIYLSIIGSGLLVNWYSSIFLIIGTIFFCLYLYAIFNAIKKKVFTKKTCTTLLALLVGVSLVHAVFINTIAFRLDEKVLNSNSLEQALVVHQNSEQRYSWYTVLQEDAAMSKCKEVTLDSIKLYHQHRSEYIALPFINESTSGNRSHIELYFKGIEIYWIRLSDEQYQTLQQVVEANGIEKEFLK